ncbi:hypothetical protein ABIB40_000888 [Pedobacter sp. UYP30]|uniref:hypothetical protein n=1 Tax=Pedobacter sp. UYP30 TaxID=1756400 RepID=UPI003396E18D
MKNLIITCCALLLGLSACKRDNYYKDGGLAKADFNGNMLQYLEAKPIPFDTIAQLVKLAKLDTVFSKDDFTFFAPTDDIFKFTLGDIHTFDKNQPAGRTQRISLNQLLFDAGRDTIKTLDQVDGAIWRKYLMRYMFHGSNRLKDYQQIDFSLVSLYGGAIYNSYGGTPTNIGVVYNDANNVKYIGYRQLAISYIYDISRPDGFQFTNFVASSDIKPTNGVVQALRFDKTDFGFNIIDVFTDIYTTGLKTK